MFSESSSFQEVCNTGSVLSKPVIPTFRNLIQGPGFKDNRRALGFRHCDFGGIRVLQAAVHLRTNTPNSPIRPTTPRPAPVPTRPARSDPGALDSPARSDPGIAGFSPYWHDHVRYASGVRGAPAVTSADSSKEKPVSRSAV